MRLGKDVVRTVDLPDTPDPPAPPSPHRDPTVAQEVAALRHEVAALRAAVGQLTEQLAAVAPRA